MIDENTPAEEEKTETAIDGAGAGFTPITSQADLDRIVGSRIAQERAKFEDYAALKAKAAQFDAYEEDQKTELQKLQDSLMAADARAVEAEAKAAAEELQRLRAEIAGSSGVPLAAVSGETEAEIKASVDQLLAWRGDRGLGPGAHHKTGSGTKETVKSGSVASGRDLYKQTHGVKA